MAQRPTQTENYWVKDFELRSEDVEHLYSILLERETPLSADEMALVLFRYRVTQEEEALANRKKPGNLYVPEKSYDVGEEISFPQFDNMRGTVLDTRPGENADYGEFTVLSVKMEDGQQLEVASALQSEHILNVLEEELEEEEELLSPEELFIEYGGYVAEEISERLAEHEDLVRLAGRWFPRSLLVDVNIGHLNLTEAILDIHGGGPMSTPGIIEELGMLKGVNERLAEFSLNYALQEDERFDEVGPAGQVLWYLERMEPEGVKVTPERLEYDEIEYPPEVLTPELRQLELEIGDEHSNISVRRGYVPQEVTLTLTYPHRASGTLPLSPLLRRMFPTAYEAPRIRFTMLDEESDEEIPAWVVRTDGYVYGLEGWFEENEIPVGGYLTLEQTDVGGEIRIRAAQRNPRKEWVRTAIVDNNRLTFDNQQATIACDYDDLMIVNTEDEEALQDLWQTMRERDVQLEDVLVDVAQALSRLNPQGNIHAKTLYSALNVVYRCPPGPIFAFLVLSPEFEHVGGPYWKLSQASSEG